MDIFTNSVQMVTWYGIRTKYAKIGNMRNGAKKRTCVLHFVVVRKRYLCNVDWKITHEKRDLAVHINLLANWTCKSAVELLFPCGVEWWIYRITQRNSRTASEMDYLRTYRHERIHMVHSTYMWSAGTYTVLYNLYSPNLTARADWLNDSLKEMSHQLWSECPSVSLP